MASDHGDVVTSKCVLLTKLSPSASLDNLRNSFEVRARALPPLEVGKVRVRIAYAALNFADVLLAQGKYQERPALPAPLGSECSGVIAVTNFLDDGDDDGGRRRLVAGRRVAVVCANLGAFAEHVDAEPWQVLPLPSSLSSAVAAGFVVAAGTAHVGLIDRAEARPGETVVVTGASGGAGLYACLVAAARGCRVVATARGATKTNLVRSALSSTTTDDRRHVVVDLAPPPSSSSSISSSSPLEELVRAVLRIDPNGAGIVYDTVGEPRLFRALLKCAKWKCRICVVGFASGSVPEVPANVLLVKNSSLMGVYWGRYFARERRTVLKSLRDLFDMVEDGRLSLNDPSIAAAATRFVWDLDDLPAALAALAGGRTYGKVLVRCDPYARDEATAFGNSRSKL